MIRIVGLDMQTAYLYEFCVGLGREDSVLLKLWPDCSEVQLIHLQRQNPPLDTKRLQQQLRRRVPGLQRRSRHTSTASTPLGRCHLLCRM